MASLVKSRGIALHLIRYRETSVIARVFTEETGLHGFVVNGVRTGKSKTPPALFQPLQLLDLVYYFDPKRELHRINEIKPALPLRTIPFLPVKTTQALFLAEVLGKVIREGQAHAVLFDQIWNDIVWLDGMQDKAEAAHIFMLKKMLAPLGIQPAQWEELFLSNQLGQWPVLSAFLNEDQMQDLPSGLRSMVLDRLMWYLQNHLEGMGTVRSLEVLKAVFRS